MRNILYICTKSQYEWDSFIPQQESSPSKIKIAVVLLQSGMELGDIPTSQVSVLETEGINKDKSGTYGAISYQGFLEKIFGADLPLVI